MPPMRIMLKQHTSIRTAKTISRIVFKSTAFPPYIDEAIQTIAHSQ